MVSKRKFYRKVFHIEVLSEKPIPETCLNEINYMITDGPWSGYIGSDGMEEVDGAQMAKLLQGQASNPGFFNLTETGEDADE
jgi:hypothetical protein